MTPVLLALVAVTGGVGAVLRFLVDTAVRRLAPPDVPAGTTVVNLSGSFLLGVVVGAAGRGLLDPAAVTVLGTGLLGGYTTFSTTSVEVVRLSVARGSGTALGVAVAQVVAAVALAWAGLLLGAAVA